MRFTHTNLKPYIDTINQHVQQIINREGINHMTITAQQDTTNNATAVTIDTPEGTIVRLREGEDLYMSAKAGALGVIGSGKGTFNPDRFIDIRWLKGHERLHENGQTYVQMDGGYLTKQFEVCEFQVGDRVKVVNSLFENGTEGVISAVPATSGDDCVVEVDRDIWGPTHRTVSFNFSALEKVEPEPEVDYKVGDRVTVKYGHKDWDGPATITEISDRGLVIVKTDRGDYGGFDHDEVEPLVEEQGEDLAEWEKELLTATEKEFQEDDLVVLVVAGDDFNSEWNGLRCRVLRKGHWGNDIFVQPLEERPDKYDLAPFNWDRAAFRAFDPAVDFKVGDLVEAERYGKDGVPAKAIVTMTENVIGGDIETDWIEGIDSLVAYGPIGASRKYLTLIGVHKPEPVVEDFTFEAGQEIGSLDVLDDLPLGTILTSVDGDEEAGIFIYFVKTKTGLVAVNGSGNSFKEPAEDMDIWLNDESALLIVHVPAESV